MRHDRTRTAAELEARLAELRMEYDLAAIGLRKAGFSLIPALLGALATLGVGAFAFIRRGPGFLSGNQLVVIFTVLVLALVVQLAFVYGRSLKIRAQITQTKRELEIVAGDRVR